MLDGNNLDFVQEKANQLITDPKLGVVVNVYEHLVEDDDSNFECDIIIDGKFEERAVPYNGGHSAHISPPKVGDTVLTVYREGENTAPVLLGTGYTNNDRAPLARAGMYRDVFDSWQEEVTDEFGNVLQEERVGPAGTGDITVTGYTQYDDNPARVNKSDLTPQRSWYQIAKHEASADPADTASDPMVVEMYDSPADDEAHVTISLNRAGGNSTQGTWGIKFDVKQGSFKIVDSEGYGIESDGSGNFTWNYETIEYSEGTTDFL